MRVVSLLPAATEICFAIGVEPVGVSHECDHPPAATSLPAVNELRIDETGSSADINEAVADAETGGGVYAIDRERLAALDPDVVLTQGVCDVCAVDRVLVREAIDELALDAEVVTLDVHSLDDLYRAIDRVGVACGRQESAAALTDRLEARVEAVAESVADVSPASRETAATEERIVTPSNRTATDSERPRVAVLDWLDPVMVAGHWVPELVELAGGSYDMEAAGAHSRPREWSELREYDPEVLVVSPCGFELPQVRENLDEVTHRPGWDQLTAVQRDRVYLVDGHHYVNRAGPRLVDTLEYLAAMISPAEYESPPNDAVERLDASTG